MESVCSNAVSKISMRIEEFENAFSKLSERFDEKLNDLSSNDSNTLGHLKKYRS